MVADPTTDWINPSLHAWLQAQEMMMQRSARSESTSAAISAPDSTGQAGKTDAPPVKPAMNSTA
jgi:hypothetical protein